MANIKFLMQGILAGNDHETAVLDLLTHQQDYTYLISAAFARKSGVELIAPKLEHIKDDLQILIGIRNGTTSKQALVKLLELGVNPYVVDMASNKRIYHPKIYAALGPDKVRCILGSANLTYSGLNENVEASTDMTLSVADKDDAVFINSFNDAVEKLITNYPQHVFQVNTQERIDALVDEGRLEDESIKVVRSIGRASSGKTGAILKAMPVLTTRVRKVSTTTQSGSVRISSASNILWKMSNLVERDLCIPKKHGTHQTGSIGIKKGLLENIDHRHHFRDVVFAGLDWKFDTAKGKTHLEKAKANFEIIIDGISYGVFTLGLSHNTRRDTVSYRQKNTMTQLQWRGARKLIAKREHLGKDMTLYGRDEKNFQLVIS